MPTDGADFGRTRPCYGKAYVMARDGAEDAAVAECAVRGVEIDIRRDGGAPIFPGLVEALATATVSRSDKQLLALVDGLEKKFREASLSRIFATAAVRVGLAALAEGRALDKRCAAEALVAEYTKSRFCDGMHGYLTRNRTKNLEATSAIVASINSLLPQMVPELADRMLRCSPKGLPARAPKAAQIDHSADGLDEEI